MSNDNKVVPFKVVTSEVTPSDQKAADPLIVKMFETYLKLARDGKIKFAAIAAVDDEGVAITTWEPETSAPTVITQAAGSVAMLCHRFMAAVESGSVDA